MTSISVSDLTKPIGGPGYGQGCTSPLKIKTQQVFDWQNSNVKMSEPSSISLIKPNRPLLNIQCSFGQKNISLHKIDDTPASILPP